MNATAAAVAAALGRRVESVRHLPGGSINRALEVVLDDGTRLFVKHRTPSPPGMFASEAAGLAWLAEPGVIRLPRVVACHDDWLALEWLPPGRPAADHDERLGWGLAALHRCGAPAFGVPATTPSYIGPIALPGGWCDDWAEFLAEHRLLPLAEAAYTAGMLTLADVTGIQGLCARLAQRLGPAEPPSRLHGDLWAGNAHAGPDGAPVLVDPAAFGGHREIDLAMMRLFGGFSRRVFDAYADRFPPAPGADERVELYQLLPLLVHATLFGGSYVTRVRDVVARYG